MAETSHGRNVPWPKHPILGQIWMWTTIHTLLSSGVSVSRRQELPCRCHKRNQTKSLLRRMATCCTVPWRYMHQQKVIHSLQTWCFLPWPPCTTCYTEVGEDRPPPPNTQQCPTIPNTDQSSVSFIQIKTELKALVRGHMPDALMGHSNST